MVCNVCNVEKEEKDFQRYWHKTQGCFRVRRQCSKCFYFKRKKNKLIEEPIQQEIIQPQPILEEIQPSYDETTHKICKTCNEIKSLDQYGRYTKYPDTPKPHCKNCERIREGAKYRAKVDKKGGNDRCPPKPNRYADHNQKEQTFEFLLLLGWKFNENKGIWWKEGIKTEDGVFINIKKKVKVPKPKPVRGLMKRGRKAHPAWLRKDDIRKLRKEGMKFHELSKLFNATPPTIREIVYSENEEATR